MKLPLSVVILTRNEQENIALCLKSIEVAEEIIIIDDYSTDKTVSIARAYTKHIYQRHLDGDFAAQRNFGEEKASCEWVLFVDADEVVTPHLREELIKTVNNKKNNKVAYYIKRRDIWWGRELHFGETMKVARQGLIRLMRKGKGKWVGYVHERYTARGKTGTLKNNLKHYPHQSVKDFIKSVNEYSTIRAKELKASGKKTNRFEIIAYPSAKFILTYFIKLGFLDGPAGFAYAFFMSFHSFLVRAKLYQYWNFPLP